MVLGLHNGITDSSANIHRCKIKGNQEENKQRRTPYSERYISLIYLMLIQPWSHTVVLCILIINNRLGLFNTIIVGYEPLAL